MFLLHASMLSAVDIQYVFGVTSKGYLGGGAPCDKKGHVMKMGRELFIFYMFLGLNI